MSNRAAAFRKPLVAMLLLIPLAGGCSVNPVTGRRELILIPESQEIAMGLQAAPQFEKEFGGRVPSAELQQYVQSVGAKVAGVSDRRMPYEYVLVASKVPNAFALPGGKIFLTAGLMKRMSNERQLAAVLGHETSHVAARHNIKGMQRQMGAEVLVKIAGYAAGQDKGQAAEAATKVVTSMGTLKYGRDDEYQADEVGIRYMSRAGYNPWGMVELLTVLLNLSQTEPGALAEMFQTHPLSSKRIAEAREIIQRDPALSRYSEKAGDPDRERFGRMRELLQRLVP